MTAREPRSTRQTRRRRVWFRLLAVTLGFGVILGCELLLRAFSIGEPGLAEDPFVGFSDMRPLFVLNRQEGRYEIPVARQKFFRPESFAATKPGNEFRIFVFGGSTVQGRPYAIETSFTTWLELNLRTLDPDRSWRVINCGGVSYASYRLLPIMQEALAYEPDMFIVYSGHNEFLEARSYARTKQLVEQGGPLVRVLATSRLYALASGAMQGVLSERTTEKPQLSAEVDALLDYRGGLAKYHRDDAWRDDVVRHFEYNLRRMIALSDKHHIPLVLLNPVSNLKDSPPFKMQFSADLSHDARRRITAIWDQAKSLSSDEADEAVKLLNAALEIDPRHAGLWFHLAKCLEGAGRPADAKQAYVRAKDEDICPLRILESQTEVIQRVARETCTPLVDVRGNFAELAPQGMPGKELMIDHVHPTIRGHQIIAELLVDQLRAQGTIVVSKGRELPRADYKQHLALLDETYFERGRERLEGLRRWSEGRAYKVLERQP